VKLKLCRWRVLPYCPVMTITERSNYWFPR